MPNEELDTNLEEGKREFKVPENSQNNGKNLILLFVVTFVIVVIFASIFFKGLFSSVDVNIGENPVASMDQRGDEDELNIRAQIDQRLKMIQNEEEMPGVADRGYETDEEIIDRLRREETKDKDKDKNEASVDEDKTEQVKTINTIEEVRIPIETPKTEVVNTSTNTVSKIYIGQFSDMQKAVDMQTNLINSGLSITPVIKEVNGYYTIQVGAFSNYDSAKALSDQINNAGFAAKIVRELK